MTAAVYRVNNGELVPSDVASGPWYPGVQHGGAVAGLIARAIEQTPSPVPMDLARLTIELVRKVPMGPTTVEVEITRAGRRIQGLSVHVLVDGQVTTTATALRIRREAGAIDGALLDAAPFVEPEPIAPPDSVTRADFDTGRPDFWNCFDSRQVLPADQCGGVEMGSWFRLVQPLVEGESTTPLVRLACCADFVMTATWLLGFDDYLSPNPDLTVSLRRPPQGEWFGLRSRVWVHDHGIGMAEADLFDEGGAIGRATKSLLIAKR